MRALIHGLYASGMTQPALFEFVCSVGIQISEGQIHNILMGEAGYAKHSEAILSAGLQEVPYINLSFGFFCPYNTKKGMNRLLNEIGVTGKRLRLICLETVKKC